MKFSAAVVLAAAAGTYAQSDVLNPIFTKVGSAIDDLATAAGSFNGDVAPVKSKADALVATIKSGVTTASGSKDLDLNGALGLTTPVQGLTKKGQALADAFKAKLSDVQKAGACGTVRTELSDINTNSQALIKAVVSKVPEAAQSIAQQLADGLTKVLNQAQSDFSEANCKDSGSPSGSKTGGSSQTSAPATKTGGQTSAPGTTLAPTTTAAPTGGNGGNGTATGTTPPITAGAAFLAPAGALVMAVAAALL